MDLFSNSLDKLIESQVFYPDPHIAFLPGYFGLRSEDVWLETDDGATLHSWLIPADSPKALVLFCHGNAGNISHRLDNVRRLNEIGLSVLIFDYRGYGRSGGEISEQGFYRDAEAAYRVARARADNADLKLVIFGRSLGGIAAVHIASANQCAGVILESTFTNLADMAGVFFPLPLPKMGMDKRFNAVDKVGAIRAPILSFHGDADEIVPFRLGRRLFDAAPEPKEFVTLKHAGHNDTYLTGGKAYFDKIAEFVEKAEDRK